MPLALTVPSICCRPATSLRRHSHEIQAQQPGANRSVVRQVEGSNGATAA